VIGGRANFGAWNLTDTDSYGNTQNIKYFTLFNGANVMNYIAKANYQDIPTAANDLCFIVIPRKILLDRAVFRDPLSV